MKKNLIVYLAILAFFGLAIALTLEHGRKLHSSGVTPPPATAQPQAASDIGPSVSLLHNLKDNFQDPLARLFVQLILIVLIARAFGALAGHARQPAVIGEMAAGILLGPSLLGWLAPDGPLGLRSAALIQATYALGDIASATALLQRLQPRGAVLWFAAMQNRTDLGPMTPEVRRILEESRPPWIH